MAGTYSQIYIQIVFGVKYREALIDNSWKTNLHKYIAGIIKGKDQKPIIVNGVEDHVHILVGLKPSIAISDLVRDIKNNSTNFINDQRLAKKKFAWQGGFGAFSYHYDLIESVYDYIMNQEEHHRRHSFMEEYTELLRQFHVTYDPQYILDQPV